MFKQKGDNMKIKINHKALEQARKDKGLSREKLFLELSKLEIVCSSRVIAAWETQETSPKSIALYFALCKVLEKEPEDFILIDE